MALPLWLLLGAGGLLKSAAIDAPRAKRQRILASQTDRYSPWTGMRGGAVEEADPIGSALNFGLTGAMIQGGQAKLAADTAINNKYLELMKAGLAKPTVVPSLGGGGMLGAYPMSGGLPNFGVNPYNF